ncbi:MAG: glutamate 5-kinase [Lentisphaeria bacterium]|nr:glutamate 5-kinase [Lentisphaeria bacterium]NQZ70707.1 glutamate 5-kinase [Lentisphaeria bacterium]
MIDPELSRKEVISKSKRITIKVGSRLLTDMSDASMAERIDQLVGEIAILRDKGLELILVSSGAIAAGMKITNCTKRPDDISQLQALAAIGQSRMMYLYETACQKHGFHCGQILLSADDVKDRHRHLNARNCISALISQKVLPIINENDTVNVDEIKIGDNDNLAALLSVMIRSDLTILLTTENGMRERVNQSLGDRISVIDSISDELESMALGTDGNQLSTGGMSTKINAAKTLLSAGEAMWIANAENFSILKSIFNSEDIGTLFYPGAEKLASNKRWLTYFADPEGSIVIDAGAVTALVENGKSLLPSGISSVSGRFEKGDSVKITDSNDETIAVGISNYSTEDIQQILGKKSAEIFTILGRHAYDEVVHRNNMAIIK